MATNIENWNELSPGDKVIEDTYNEVYEFFLKDGQPWLVQVGWLYGNKPVPDYARPCDFEPNCMYDQQWIKL